MLSTTHAATGDADPARPAPHETLSGVTATRVPDLAEDTGPLRWRRAGTLLVTFALLQAIAMAIGIRLMQHSSPAVIALLAVQALVLGTSLVAVAFGYRRLRMSFSRPLARFSAAARAIAAGAYDQRVRVRSHDECAELAQSFNRMAEAVGRKTARLQALNEVALAVTSSLCLDDILDRIMRYAIGLTDSSAACIALYDEGSGRFGHCVTRGLSKQFMQNMAFRAGGLAEEAFRGGHYIVSSDRPGAARKLSDLARREGVRAFLCLPLSGQGQPLGVLYLYRSDRDDFDPDEIEFIHTFSYLAAQAIANAKLYAETTDLAEIDALTGLANRRRAEARFRAEIARAQRLRQPFALVLLDIDHFKRINDTHGHLAGDAVLKDVARIVQGQIRDIDFVARIGGEEFLLLLPATDSGSGAGFVAERVRDVIARTPLRLIDDTEVRLTLSAGIACYPACGVNTEHLLEHADQALYVAKEQGRDRVVFYRDVLTATLENEPRRMAELLARSLENIGVIHTALDVKMPFRHDTDRTLHLALDLARALELGPDELERLQLAARLLRIGTIATPEGVLSKPGPLTADEWEVVRRQPVLAAEILMAVPGLSPLAPIVRARHERYDGTGYPDGLSAGTIPKLARIMAIADAYSAMISERPYRPAMDAGQACAAIESEAGRQFDPDMAQAFVQMVSSGRTRPARDGGDDPGVFCADA